MYVRNVHIYNNSQSVSQPNDRPTNQPLTQKLTFYTKSIAFTSNEISSSNLREYSTIIVSSQKTIRNALKIRKCHNVIWILYNHLT